MTFFDYMIYYIAVAVAHKYLFIAAIVLFECVLALLLVQKVVVMITGERSTSLSPYAFASNAFRNSLVMGLAVIFLAGVDVFFLTFERGQSIVTPSQWSITMATLVCSLIINSGVWATLYSVKRRLAPKQC